MTVLVLCMKTKKNRNGLLMSVGFYIAALRVTEHVIDTEP